MQEVHVLVSVQVLQFAAQGLHALELAKNPLEHSVQNAISEFELQVEQLGITVLQVPHIFLDGLNKLEQYKLNTGCCLNM